MSGSMNHADPIVFIIDDDASFRRSTGRLIQSMGFQVKTFGGAAEFLSTGRTDVPSCMVLDVRLPGLSGLDLQQELGEAGIEIPIIFITGHGDIPMSVRAMKAGAVEFLTKPFREQDLLDAIRQAVKRDHVSIAQRMKRTRVRALYDSLTPREREVMTKVVLGLLNKQIASELGMTEKTVKFHRGHVMRKMRAQSVADLVRMDDQLW
jgi:FixJ family two-component response regulator